MSLKSRPKSLGGLVRNSLGAVGAVLRSFGDFEFEVVVAEHQAEEAHGEAVKRGQYGLGPSQPSY